MEVKLLHESGALRWKLASRYESMPSEAKTKNVTLRQRLSLYGLWSKSGSDADALDRRREKRLI